jgi:hypothetical protein
VLAFSFDGEQMIQKAIESENYDVVAKLRGEVSKLEVFTPSKVIRKRAF